MGFDVKEGIRLLSAKAELVQRAIVSLAQGPVMN
jgi:hypothetical protein